MTAPQDQIDPIARHLATVMRGLMREEVEKLAPKVVPATKADSEIMAACQVVAVATDKLLRCRLTVGEKSARIGLELACNRLAALMKKHGRWPDENAGGEDRDA